MPCCNSINKHVQVSIHLRGPMNISQLAVYQLPAEVHTMQKRTTVPFYNRRRAAKREVPTNTSTATAPTQSKAGWFPFFKAQPLPNTTYVGPPLPCLPTPATALGANLSSPDNNCACNSTKHLVERPDRQPFVSATPSPTHDASRNAKRQADSWSRVAYYTSTAPAQATGLTFMANLGDPQKSGTFD
jgi:hypothetical protein